MLVFPEYAVKCIEKIEENGFEAYFVGGCVRDGLLGRDCDDIDITTSATPDDICRIFDRTVPTGIKHGTVTVLTDGASIEVTTYRVEGGYRDSRHPDEVNFVKDIKEDLARRDFTVNAMAFNPRRGLLDVFGGEEDLKNGVIRTVGNARERFGEDALRILRAIRFACVLDFRIEGSTLCAAMELKDKLRFVSGERILKELIKLSAGKVLTECYDFVNSGALSDFGIYRFSVDRSALSRLAEKSLTVDDTFALLISYTDHNTAVIRDKLRTDNITDRKLRFLDQCVSLPPTADRIALKKLISKYGMELITLLLHREDKENSNISREIYDILSSGEPYSIKQLAISGEELKGLGYSGKDIGTALSAALDAVIKRPELNRSDFLIELLKK